MRTRIVILTLLALLLMLLAPAAAQRPPAENERMMVTEESPALGQPTLIKKPPVLTLGGVTLYFSDGQESPGSVYVVRTRLGLRMAAFTRVSGRVSAFAFAPWDPDRLFYLDANGSKIYETTLGVTTPVESVVYTHSTYVRDLAFDEHGMLYFSEATGAGADGKIWRLDASGTPSLFFDVPLSQVGGFWAGDFGYAPDGTLLLSSGNQVPSSFYEADRASGVIHQVFHTPSQAITGFAFGPRDGLYVTDNHTLVQTLNLGTGTFGPVWNDTHASHVSEVGFRPTGPAGPSTAGTWVMATGIRGVRTDQIKPTGLIDYKDGVSGRTMVDAPFGGGLWIRVDSSNDVPTPDVYYYRLRYRREGTTGWADFDHPISVHYVRNKIGQTPVFPTFNLGPKEVAGKNLYRFRPHVSELPSLVPVVPGTMVDWPKIPFGADLYRGYLDTVGKGLAAGRWELRLEIYDQTGTQTVPGVPYQLIVPSGVGASGTLLTTPATVVSGGFELTFHVDNRKARAEIAPPAIGATLTEGCGFLRYDPMAPGLTELGWYAWQDGGFAIYRYKMVKGANALTGLPLAPTATDPMPMVPLPIWDEVASMANHGDGMGNFHQLSPVIPLLDGCVEGAFAIDLDVLAKATTGNGHRITTYDASALRAFALAPQ